MDGTLPDPWYDGGPRVASFWHCTTMRVLAPLVQATVGVGADAVLTGSRATDAPVFHRMGVSVELFHALPGAWTRYNPLSTWSDADVWAYIDANAIALPAHYQWKRDSAYEWPDCLPCPYNPAHAQWLKHHRPDDYAAMMQGFAPALAQMRQIASQELAAWEGVGDA